MTDYSISKVGVVGGGTMGSGIAALIARQNRPVVVREANEAFAEAARRSIDERFQKWFDLRKFDERRLEELRSYVEVTTRSEDFRDVQLFIEAVTENLELKKEIFREFDAILPPGVIMASNTSSLPITEIAAATSRPDRIAGMHFFNPPTSMKLVELVRGGETSDETLASIESFARETLQKETIRVADRPGFLVNCLLVPYLNEAVLALEEAVIAPAAIDAAARNYGWPMGPFTLLDVVGIDTARFVADILASAYPHRCKTPALFDLLTGMKRFGDKTGAGFYVTDGAQEPIESILAAQYPNRKAGVEPETIFERMMAGLLNEAAGAVEDGVASKEDIERGAFYGIGCPKGGPLHIIDEMGAKTLFEKLSALERSEGTRFAPQKLLREMTENGRTFFQRRQRRS